MVFNKPYPSNIHRTVTEGQTIILDCTDLLQSFRHVIQGKDQFRWLKEHHMLGSSSQLIFKADKSTQGSYKCLARAGIAGEQVVVMMRKTVHITVESEPPATVHLYEVYLLHSIQSHPAV